MKEATTGPNTTNVVPSMVGFEAVARLLGREPDQAARTFIAKKCARNEFPRPFKLSPSGRKIAWSTAEVNAWLSTRPRVSYASEAAHVG